MEAQESGIRTGSALSEESGKELVRDLTTKLTRLVHDEMLSAQRELRRKLRACMLGAALLGMAGLSGFYGGGCVLAAIILALNGAGKSWEATLVVGIVLIVISGVLGLPGVGRLRKMGTPIPETTATSVMADIDAIRKGVE